MTYMCINHKFTESSKRDVNNVIKIICVKCKYIHHFMIPYSFCGSGIQEGFSRAILAQSLLWDCRQPLEMK